MAIFKSKGKLYILYAWNGPKLEGYLVIKYSKKTMSVIILDLAYIDIQVFQGILCFIIN